MGGIGQIFSPHGIASLWHQLTNSQAATSAANNPGSAPRPTSIVGITSLGAQAEQAGFYSVLMLLIAINIVFGLLNMLPMIPLDGGHVAIAAYEWIRTKKGQALLPRRHHQALPRGRGLHRVPRVLHPRRALFGHHPSAASHRTDAVELSSSLLSPRRPTRRITLGGVPIGDGAPVTVQSMTTTKTADVDGTLAQVYALAAAGADIVRCTCNEEAAAEGLAHIVPRSPVPIVADIHFHHEMALAALEAGVQGLRLNPGNLRKEAEIKQVAAEARDRGVPIRIGVNAGSLHPDLYKKHGGATPEALVESAQHELAFFEEVGFSDVKISVKASSVALMIAAYRLASETFDHPLHLGVTEAGPPPAGLVKGTAGIGALLAEGIGDTIRFSLTADPVEEARAGRQLLESLGLRERKGLDLIACPSCGRAQVDVIAVAKEAQEALEKLALPIQVAVMGCVVNGPGEAREADIGIAAGKQKGHLFIRGKIIRVVPEADDGERARRGGGATGGRRRRGAHCRGGHRGRGGGRGRPASAARVDRCRSRTTRRRRSRSSGVTARTTPGPEPAGRSFGVRGTPSTLHGCRRVPSSRAKRTSRAGTKRSSPARRWPTTARHAAPWSSGPGAMASGS